MNGNLFRDAIISGAHNIINQRESVDALNVFPVPDGDTGTNMSMTITNAVKELARVDNKTVGEVAAVTASALLRGARGNSGVILSVIFRGFAKGLKDHDELDAEGLTVALETGVEAAYKAVMKPTEGTVLTVARVASEKAREAYNAGKNATEIFEVIVEAGNEALARTPEILPVLKKAGVVDAGGKGFMVIMEGMLSVLRDGKMIETDESVGAPAEKKDINAAGSKYDAEITFTYCTEFIVNRADNTGDPRALRAYLESIGDCVVVVDDDDIIKVHVHTNHPGNAIEKGITFGQLVNMKIENMRDQHERAKHDAAETEEAAPITPAEPEKPFGFVSVVAGKGLENLFVELGVDQIVSGGQTMNPSTEDILKAIEKTPAEYVFVLPNNKNIIMAAEQTVSLTTKKVIVIPTRTIPQGITAMLNFNPDADSETNAVEMANSYTKVSTGSVTFAARDSSFDGYAIKEGELLALNNGKIAFVEQHDQLGKCVAKLTKQMLNKDSAFVTLFYGADVSAENAEAISEQVKAKLPKDVEVTLIEGGQPVYYFLISVE